ncbi:hypothetical protein SAMN04488512_12633 [Sulfitobacter litoralis]|jgi:hypothetical protein|uniref:Uncharacterized protein n=1 Tax=Sulfitobacter litoralis TaxID=335975 RepID=A0ABY0SW85_9RHOB|nr:hypothetical protein SAMN04488512_12633 [Sulfitobacter litoralis]|tara:strand:+ start:757 stop:1122 length:366 start_codon:yes stop_codon:yes gene_type:complete
MQHSMLIPTESPRPTRATSGLKAVRRFAQRDGATLIRVLRTAVGPSGVAAAERLLDGLWSLEPQQDEVQGALKKLVQMTEALPPTVDQLSSEPDAWCDDLDNAIRYFGARLTDLAGGLATG